MLVHVSGGQQVRTMSHGPPDCLPETTLTALAGRYLDGAVASIAHERIPSHRDARLASPQISEFRDTLASGSLARNRLDCEGFDKYLDSLAFVSQRGVLIKHDTDLRTKITGDLERAVKYAALMPEVACEVIEQAFIKAERLLGLNDQIDALVSEWTSLTAEQRLDPDQAVPLGRQLLDIVRPAPVAPPPADGDAF